MKRIYKTITKMYDRDFLTSQEFQKAMNQTIKFKDKINY